jgi:hypothetical protein
MIASEDTLICSPTVASIYPSHCRGCIYSDERVPTVASPRESEKNSPHAKLLSLPIR